MTTEDDRNKNKWMSDVKWTEYVNARFQSNIDAKQLNKAILRNPTLSAAKDNLREGNPMGILHARHIRRGEDGKQWQIHCYFSTEPNTFPRNQTLL